MVSLSEKIQALGIYVLYLYFFWYGLAIIMFVIALFTQREVFALLALVAAMMKRD